MLNGNQRAFVASLYCRGDSVETTEHLIRVSPVPIKRESQPRYKHLQRVPYHEGSEVSASTVADCYLQIWELDFYRTGRYLAEEETDLNIRQNRLIATFPGLVVKNGRTYTFQPIGDSNLAQRAMNWLLLSLNTLNGKITLRMTKATQTKPENLVISMPEYESIFELAVVLRRNSGDKTFANYQNAYPYQVRNVEASLRRQIRERGGFAVAFVADYRAKFPSTKEEEFHKQAEQMIATLPTFKLESNKIKMGYHLISDYSKIADILVDLREAVKNLLSMTTAPKVAMMSIYAHGLRTKLKIECNGYNLPGSLRTDRVKTFVSQIKDHLSEYVVIPIFACSAGRGNLPNPDNMYGRAYPCEELGGDSLAWTLYRELVRAGIVHPTIWAHTTAAHTTRNSRLRLFSPYGTADFVNLVLQTPRVPVATVKSYATPLKTVKYSKAKAALFRKRLHNANLIRAISLQSALYLPWRWKGGENSTSTTAGFNAEANRQADKFYKEIRDLLPARPDTLKDIFVYEDRKRAYITGLAPGVSNARLSENFSYSAISSLSNPMRISVQLMKYVQLLRYRTRRRVIPKRIYDKGDGLSIEVSPNTDRNRTLVLNEAKNMVKEGLFTYAALGTVSNTIYITVVPKHIYFAMYYRVPDNAFKRAAETWKRKVEQSSSYRRVAQLKLGTIIMEEVRTEADFKNAWSRIYKQLLPLCGVVVEGQLFTHATKQTDEKDGLEFKPTGSDGTLTRGEIRSLPKLNWDDKNGLLVLRGCNTGLSGSHLFGLIGKRNWTPAREFAKSQKVKTIGQAGFSYFSQNENKHVEINQGSKQVYLWAYECTKNVPLGWGLRMDGIPFWPDVAEFVDKNGIVPRDTWGRLKPQYSQLASDWDYKSVVIHDIGNWGTKNPSYIEGWQMRKNKFPEIGFHFLIAPNGTIYEGRKLFFRGDHMRAANTGKIGILVLGDFQDNLLEIDDDPTKEQTNSLVKLVLALKGKFSGIVTLGAHRDFDTTTKCPGDDLYKLLPNVRVKTGLQSP